VCECVAVSIDGVWRRSVGYASRETAGEVCAAEVSRHVLRRHTRSCRDRIGSSTSHRSSYTIYHAIYVLSLPIDSLYTHLSATLSAGHQCPPCAYWRAARDFQFLSSALSRARMQRAQQKKRAHANSKQQARVRDKEMRRRRERGETVQRRAQPAPMTLGHRCAHSPPSSAPDAAPEGRPPAWRRRCERCIWIQRFERA
jgi:hypothetical protein